MTTPDPNALEERARDLERQDLNGIRLAIVSLTDEGSAQLNLHFHNENGIDDLVELVNNTDSPRPPKDVFPITGGERVLAGPLSGQVQVSDVKTADDDKVLSLTIEPVGDYSTYTLSVVNGGIDPLFSRIDFKFRPGCFNNCPPERDKPRRAKSDPSIDYLAKDYESFRHSLIAWMTSRLPGWEATSEADLDMVIIELLSAAADELSDYQDRVTNEAYLASARKRVSIARHARLMGYNIHEGNQASTWQVLEVKSGEVPVFQDPFEVWTGEDRSADESVEFASRGRPKLFSLPLDFQSHLDGGVFLPRLSDVFADNGHEVSSPSVDVKTPGSEWLAENTTPNQFFLIRRFEDEDLLRVYAPPLHPLLNGMGLYTWSSAFCTLPAGSTSADLSADDGDQAEGLQNLLRGPLVTHLVLQEHLNPLTGVSAGRDPDKRQLLELVDGDAAAEAMHDPVEKNASLVRVRWKEKDALRAPYCFAVKLEDDTDDLVHDVSLFHGNLIRVFQGRRCKAAFKDPEATLVNGELHYEFKSPVKGAAEGKRVVICRLPEAPLAYQNTPPGGETPAKSTLAVKVHDGATIDSWDEVASLVHSDDSSEGGDHFVVETNEDGRSLLRFGDGENGRKLPDGAEVHCEYQVGSGASGNVGSDTLVSFDSSEFPQIARTWNPFDVTDGRGPEPMEEIVRRAPEAYRRRQLRAVTPEDYENRVEEVPGVSRASALYLWAGSWRTVRVTVDPVGSTTLSEQLRDRVARHLEAVRLIGEDLEIRPPRFVPLEILVSLCIDADYWPEDVRFFLEQEFSDGFTPNGRMAFFHPDRWTFGQELRASQIIGRVQAIPGVDHVIEVKLQRSNEPTTRTSDLIAVRPNEIILVKNNPDSMEQGSIKFNVRGGRQ